jgi:O-antigen/teichoic acid export membrane protein
MSLSTTRRGTKSYFASGVVAMACAAVRYLVFARILGPHELGLAATLILTASFLDIITDTGSDRFLVQDENGGEPGALAMVHMVLVIRGVLTAAVLVAGSSLIAAFYRAPNLQMGFVAMAAYPLINGFQNADMRRQQRDHDFRAEGVCVIAAELVGICVAVASAVILHNFYCVVLAFIARALVFVPATHLTAKAPYRIAFVKPYAVKLTRFGGPLILNGVLTFFGAQGDRLVIANRLAVTELGLYSAVSLLAFYPTAILSRFLLGIQMPLVANARQTPGAEGAALDAVAGDTTLLSIGAAAGFALVTPFVLVPLYGARFAQSTTVIVLVGVLQAWRLLRFWPTTVALGIGRSMPVLISAVARLVALPLSVAAMALGYGMDGIIASFIFGEVVACVVNLVMVNAALPRALLADFDRLGLMAACGGAIYACARATSPVQIALAAGLSVVVAGVTIARERRCIARWVKMSARFAADMTHNLSLRFRASG